MYSTRTSSSSNRKKSHFVVQEETQSILGQSRHIDLDKIGEVGQLSCPGYGEDRKDLKLTYEIETEGATRVLTVVTGDFVALQQRGDTTGINEKEIELKKQSLANLKSAIERTKSARQLLSNVKDYHHNDDDTSKNKYLPPSFDFHEKVMMKSTNQLLVEVMECRGLHAADLSGLSNPFCEIYVKSRSTRENFRMGLFKKKRTYFVEKTLAPSWHGQSFILNVPIDAIECISRRV